MAVYETTGKVLTSTPDKSSTQQVINQTSQNPATPTSSNSVYNIGVRQALNNMGVDNNRIGYNNGYVTIDGQNVIRPQYNQGGYSYTSQPYLNSINGQVNQLNTAYKLNNTVLNPGQNNNPYDERINSVLDKLTQQLNNPTPYDVYNSPEYAAYQAQAQQQAHQGIRSAQESLGASGLGRSSILADRAQGVQNQANQYLETQVVPQLIAANQAKQQQYLADLANLAGLYSGQQSTYDTRDQNNYNNSYNALNFLTNRDQRAVDNRRADAALTGYYQTPEQQQVISDLLNIKKQAETQGITAAQRTNLSAQADQLRNVLSQLGVDPSLYGANISYNQASQARPGRTLQGQQLDAQQQETAFNQALQTRQQNFNEGVQLSDITGYLNGKPTSAEQQRQLENLWMVAQQTGTIPDRLADLYGIPRGTQTQNAYQFAQQLAISQQNSNTSTNDSNFGRLLDIWKATGSAPAGIAGVTPGTPYSTGAAQSATPTTAEEYATGYLDKSAQFDPDDGTLLNADSVERQILSSGLSEKEIYKLYQRYGLPWDGPAPN